MKRSVTILISAGAGLALVTGGTAAGAAIAAGPIDGSGVIYGCYMTKAIAGSHTLVLQDVGTTCAKGTTAIQWNQTGPKGPAGPQGVQGNTGATGPAGPAGQAGPQGAEGDTGATGPAGPAGDTGATGPAGPAGAVGDTGPAGPAGADGNTVLNGTGAPAVSIGNDGDFYIDTAANVLYGPKSGGIWPMPGLSLTGPAGAAGATGATGQTGPAGPPGSPGPTGPAGADGNTVLNGTGAPAVSIGNDGDFYIDTAANVLYGPKAGGIWPMPGTSLTGPAGAQGPAGPAGAQGPAGPAGTTGQTSATVYGSNDLPIAYNMPLTQIPGLTQTVTVPANGLVLISTNGAVGTGTAGVFAQVGIWVLVDGTLDLNVGELLQPGIPSGSGLPNGWQNWALTATLHLSAGQHTISVAAIGEGSSLSPSAFIDNGETWAPANLTVTMLNT